MTVKKKLSEQNQTSQSLIWSVAQVISTHWVSSATLAETSVCGGFVAKSVVEDFEGAFDGDSEWDVSLVFVLGIAVLGCDEWGTTSDLATAASVTACTCGEWRGGLLVVEDRVGGVLVFGLAVTVPPTHVNSDLGDLCSSLADVDGTYRKTKTKT